MFSADDIWQLISGEKLPHLYRRLAYWCVPVVIECNKLIYHCRSFKSGNLQIFEWILKLVNDPEITKYCMEANKEDRVSLYHLAASANSPAALEVLLKHFGISTVVNARCTVDGNNCVTPLSLILSCGHVEHFKLLINYNLNPANAEKLVQINLSGTKIEDFSLSVLNFSSVKTLFLDNTGLKTLTWDGILLPMPNVKELQLKELQATNNLINELPFGLFTFPDLKKLDVSHNQIEKLPDNWWQGSLVDCDISYNLLEELSLPDYMEEEDTEPDSNRHALHGRSELVFNKLPKIPTHYSVTSQEEFSSPLQNLMLSNNHIRTFPKCLSCCVPVLKTLNLSHNRLTEVASINELPLSLKNLDVSHNHLGAYPGGKPIFSVSPESKPCASILAHGEQHCKCHHRSHTTLPKLGVLNLSYNKDLNNLFIRKLSTADAEASFVSEKHTSIHLFFPFLGLLNVSYCSLTELPEHFSRMKSLCQLNISGNPNLKISAEICQLQEMLTFDYQGTRDKDVVSKLDEFQHAKDKINFFNPLYGDKYVAFHLVVH